MKIFWNTSLALVLIILGPVDAKAQTIDYGSLEALFGEPVTTSATGAPERTPDVPVTMEIITADDIRRSGATNIPDVLRHVSGLSVWQVTRNQAEVGVRGYNQIYSSRLLVLINGRQVYLDLQGYMAWSTIPVQLEEIRQIEVVKGPNSALFGFNAVSGVVNIITYNPLYDDVSSAGVRVGTDSYRDGHLVHTLKLSDKASVRFSGQKKTMDSFETDSSSESFISPDKEDLSLDGVVQLTDNSQLRIEASKTNSDITEFNPGYVANAVKYNVESGKATYVVNTDLGLLQATVYRNWVTQDAQDFIPGDGIPGFLIDSQITVAQVEDNFQLNNQHRFRVQAEYRDVVLEGENLINAGAKVGYEILAMSGMWSWSINDTLSWTNALRTDYLDLRRSGPVPANPFFASNAAYNDESATEISYNSGIVWNATPKDTIRLTTARGIHAPSLVEFGQFFQIGPAAAIGNPDLDAAVVTNYELGYDRKIDGINGLFRASVFRQKTQSVKSFTTNFIGLAAQADNVGDSYATGADLSLEGAIGEHWTWGMNYTIQEVDDDFSFNTGGVPTIPQDTENAVPLHTMNLHVGYSDGPWEADGFVHYVSDYRTRTALPGPPIFGLESVDGYASLSGRVGYKINDNITVAVSGQQLNHTSLEETFAPEVERQMFLSLTGRF